MKHFKGAINAGLREKESGKLIAVYPHKLEGSKEEVEDKVKFWFYQQSCGAEQQLETLYVDVLSDQEVREHQQ